MAALVRIAAHVRVVFAAHVALRLVDRRFLGAAHDVERDGLVRIATKAANLKVAAPGIERIAERRRRLRRTLERQLRLVHASQVRRLACLRASAARSAVARTDAP
jgi:hypothetical protein